jgi:hypothetical protein
MTSLEIQCDLYYIMWSSHGLRILNYTKHDKELVVAILKDEYDSRLVSNPIRDMIVDGTIGGKPFEIWQVNSELSEEEIVAAFLHESESIKHEIRTTGELVYSNY